LKIKRVQKSKNCFLYKVIGWQCFDAGAALKRDTTGGNDGEFTKEQAKNTITESDSAELNRSTRTPSAYSKPSKVGCSKGHSYASNPINQIQQKTNSNSNLRCFYTNATSLNKKFNELKMAVSHYNHTSY